MKTSLTQEMRQADWQQARSDDFLYPFFIVCIVALFLLFVMPSPIVYNIYISLIHGSSNTQVLQSDTRLISQTLKKC